MTRFPAALLLLAVAGFQLVLARAAAFRDGSARFNATFSSGTDLVLVKLETGLDYFEKDHKPPAVKVDRGGHYVFSPE
jgi:hypothetical protein